MHFTGLARGVNATFFAVYVCEHTYTSKNRATQPRAPVASQRELCMSRLMAVAYSARCFP